MEILDVIGPGVGLFPKNTYGLAWNRVGSAVAIGDVLSCDMAASQTETVGGTTAASLTPGNVGGVTANLILPITNGIGGLSGATQKCAFFHCVVVDLMGGAGADNTIVKVQWQGIANASMVATAITVGVALACANGVSTLTPTFAAGNRAMAIAWQPNGSSAGVYQCWFDGINGFGTPAAS